MNYLHFIIIIVITFFFSLYFYKTNKKNSNVYIPQNKNDDAVKDQTQRTPFDENKAENTDKKETDDYKIEIIYYWITQKVFPNKNIDYNILKEKIIKTIGLLPEILEDKTTFIQKEQDEFLKEILGRIEYSSSFKYFIIHKGRKLFSILKNLLIIIGIMFFILFQIEIRKEYDNFGLIYFLFSVISFMFSFLFGKFSNKFLSSLLKTLKPGDYIKIISEPDELIEKEIKINQLSKNETIFNKTTVFLSKKKLVC